MVYAHPELAARTLANAVRTITPQSSYLTIRREILIALFWGITLSFAMAFLAIELPYHRKSGVLEVGAYILVGACQIIAVATGIGLAVGLLKAFLYRRIHRQFMAEMGTR